MHILYMEMCFEYKLVKYNVEFWDKTKKERTEWRCWVSNPGPSARKADATTTELHPHSHSSAPPSGVVDILYNVRTPRQYSVHMATIGHNNWRLAHTMQKHDVEHYLHTLY